MTWIKFNNAIINLENVREIRLEHEKIRFFFSKKSGLISETEETFIVFEDEKIAEKIFDYISTKLLVNSNFIDLDECLKALKNESKKTK